MTKKKGTISPFAPTSLVDEVLTAAAHAGQARLFIGSVWADHDESHRHKQLSTGRARQPNAARRLSQRTRNARSWHLPMRSREACPGIRAGPTRRHQNILRVPHQWAWGTRRIRLRRASVWALPPPPPPRPHLWGGGSSKSRIAVPTGKRALRGCRRDGHDDCYRQSLSATRIPRPVNEG